MKYRIFHTKTNFIWRYQFYLIKAIQIVDFYLILDI
jgi:hypothetical protein